MRGLTPPGAHLGPLGCSRQRGRWRVVSARAFVPSDEQALRGRRGTLSRLRVPAGAFGRVSGTASPWSPCERARCSVGMCAGHQVRAGAQACLQPCRFPCEPRAKAINEDAFKGVFWPAVGATAAGLLVWGGAAAQLAGQSRRLSFGPKARVFAGWTS
jgi:hypothetical protein